MLRGGAGTNRRQAAGVQQRYKVLTRWWRGGSKNCAGTAVQNALNGEPTVLGSQQKPVTAALAAMFGKVSRARSEITAGRQQSGVQLSVPFRSEINGRCERGKVVVRIINVQ